MGTETEQDLAISFCQQHNSQSTLTGNSASSNVLHLLHFNDKCKATYYY